MIIAFDSNILVYAEGVDGPMRAGQAVDVVRRIPPQVGRIPVQVLGELFNVLVRKKRLERGRARQIVSGWRDNYRLIGTSEAVFLGACDLVTFNGLQIWDAVILSAAAEGGCRLLLSEDMQDGFTWRGVTIVNPFAPVPHPLLATYLSSSMPPRPV